MSTREIPNRRTFVTKSFAAGTALSLPTVLPATSLGGNGTVAPSEIPGTSERPCQVSLPQATRRNLAGGTAGCVSDIDTLLTTTTRYNGWKETCST